MKITVNKEKLLEKLIPAMGTVSNKNTITSIEGVLIETVGDNKIRISTYDMNKGIRAIVETESIEEEGSYIINAQRFYQTVRVLPDEDITIEVNENLNCTISSGKASFSMLSVLNGNEFPSLPELVTENGFSIEASILRKVIGKVMHSVADQDPRAFLCGAFFKVSEGELEVVSCDGYNLSKCNVACEVENFGDTILSYSFIAPGHALGELIKILSDCEEDERVSVYVTRKHIIIKLSDIIFFTRTIDAEYMDYNRNIPTDNDIIVTVDRERILDGLERANIIADEKIQGSGKSFVKISVEEQFLTLTSASLRGKVSDEMECVHEGENIEIGFNCRYLINSVKAAEGESIKISFKSPTRGIVITAAEEDENYKYLYLILPIRMTEAK